MTDTDAPTPTVDDLAKAADQARTVIHGIKDDAANASTPCRSWAVEDLVQHLLNDFTQFTSAARGGKMDYSSSPPEVPQSAWSQVASERTDELVGAWRDGDADHSGLGMQVTELALHTWDLDQATSQGADLDPRLAEIGLASMRGMLKDEYRGSEAEGKMFGPEVEAPADAGAYEKLAAFSGRKV